ncbi:MAG: hypothetical protein EHM34_08910 [Nitrosopumilales archaeon]|nr:MAG: hypothetical protein EHM34_08910 [Nitrosopumilales archaeon]
MIGRNVEFFYVYSSQACPASNCDLDPVTNTSTNSLCPVCSGTYWIDIYSGVTMSAHITWKFDYQNEYETGGLVFIGDAKVKVMHTPEREQLIKQAKYVIVDDKTMNIEKTTLLGAPAINRIIVDVKEKED